MSWRDDLIGKEILVRVGQVIGQVAKIHEPDTFLRANAEEGEKPVSEWVLQLDNGHAFLAGDEFQTNFHVLTTPELFVVESMRESIKNGIAAGFRVAVAARVGPDDALILLMAALTEAKRALTEPEP